MILNKISEYAELEARRIGKIQGKRPVLIILSSPKHWGCIFDKFQEFKDRKNLAIASGFSKIQRHEKEQLNIVKKFFEGKGFHPKV